MAAALIGAAFVAFVVWAVYARFRLLARNAKVTMSRQYGKTQQAPPDISNFSAPRERPPR